MKSFNLKLIYETAFTILQPAITSAESEELLPPLAASKSVKRWAWRKTTLLI